MKRVAVVAALFVAVGLAAQRGQGPPPAAPGAPGQGRGLQFRSGIDLVQVDVSVLDRRDRRPVRGLRAEEFTVFENGREQPIAAFQAVDMPDDPPVTSAWLRDVVPDVRRNDEAVEHRLLVLVMDDATMIMHPPFVQSAKEIGHRVIERMGPNDMAAVIYTLDNRKSQEFTQDRQRLHEAVERFGGMFRSVSAPPDAGAAAALAEQNAFFGAIETLAKTAEYLASVPHRRKALIYVSLGVPVDTEIASTPVLASKNNPGAGEVGALLRRVAERMQNIFRQAQLANVNIYPVDPAGLGGMDQYIQAQAASGRAVHAYEKPNNYLDYLQTLAENTGGHAFINTNEFETGVEQIFRENSSYYLLGYRSPDPTADGKFRRIEVRVSRRDVDVRVRSGYYAAKAEDVERVARRPPPPVAQAISGVLPKRDVPMQLAVAPFALPSRREVAVAIATAVRQPAQVGSESFTEKVDVGVYAYNNDGRLITSQAMKADVKLRAGTSGEVGYELLSQLTLRPGRYQLRLGAHVGSIQAQGSVYYDLEVPNFAELPLSLSGVVLAVNPALMAAPKDRLKTLLPIVPTAQRDFVRSNRVTAFLRIYQGGGSRREYVDVGVALINSLGESVFQSTHEVAPDRFGPAGVEYQLELPMSRLTPGPYLLSIEATTAETSARRDIRFEVVR